MQRPLAPAPGMAAALPDDLDALKRYGQAQTFVFLVDSNRRDKAFWPSPSEYEISLSHPLRNVFSVSLLSATIPRSGYTVDASKNTLALSLTSRTPAQAVVVSLEPANYTLPTLCEALNAAFAADAAASSAGLSVSPLSSPPDLANKVSISGAEAFALDHSASTLADALGFADSPPAGGGYASAAAEGESTAAFDGPVPVANFLTASDAAPIAQAFVCSASGALTSAKLYAVPHAQGASSAGVTVAVKSGAVVLATASGTVSAATSSIPLDLVFAAGGGAALVAGTHYSIEVRAASASAPVDAYVELSNVAGDEGVAATGGVGGGGLEGQDPAEPRQLCASVFVAASGQALRSSGVCDLTGARMAVVRMPDIEQLAYEDRYAETGILTGGLGVVNLGGWGYSSATFTGFPPRVFHPLTKLSKFRVRIETEAGALFPAQGVNHTLQLAVSYLVPAAADEINLLKKLLNNK